MVVTHALHRDITAVDKITLFLLKSSLGPLGFTLPLHLKFNDKIRRNKTLADPEGVRSGGEGCGVARGFVNLRSLNVM